MDDGNETNVDRESSVSADAMSVSQEKTTNDADDAVGIYTAANKSHSKDRDNDRENESKVESKDDSERKDREESMEKGDRHKVKKKKKVSYHLSAFLLMYSAY